MKKINFLFAAFALLSMSFLSSCTEEDEPTPPSIIVTVDSEASYEPGTTVRYTLNISSNEELVSFSVNESTQSNPMALIENITPIDAIDDVEMLEFKNGLYTVTMDYVYAIPTTVAPGTSIDITFTVVDDVTEGTNTQTFDVAAAGRAINNYTAVLIGANANPTEGSFYASATNTVYSVADAASNAAAIDLVYFYGATNLASIASPDDSDVPAVFPSVSGWSTRNATRFATSSISVDDFNAIDTDEVLLQEAANIGTATKANDLAVNDIIVFETAGGKVGMAMVSALTEGNTGSITLEIKIQE